MNPRRHLSLHRMIRHDMPQEELADKLRVTRRTINSIEGGKYNPSIEVAFRMAKLFNVPVEELFSLDGDE